MKATIIGKNGMPYEIKTIKFGAGFYAHVSIIDDNGRPVATIIDSQKSQDVFRTEQKCMKWAVAQIA